MQNINKPEKKVLLQLMDKNVQLGLARESVVKEYLKNCYSKKRSSTREQKEKFIDEVNLGEYQGLLLQLGKRLNFSTLERWKKTYLDHKRDYRSLVPGYSKAAHSMNKNPLNKIIIQINLLTDKTLLPELQKEAINYIKAARMEIYTLNEIN